MLFLALPLTTVPVADAEPGYSGPVPTITDDAIVLDSRAFRDRDLLVTVLTRNDGVQRGVFRRSRGGRAPQAGAVQIMSEVRCSLYRGPHAELATFREVELITSSYGLASRLETAAAAQVVAETLRLFCPENEPAPRRYRLGVTLLKSLLAGIEPDAAIAYGQIWCLKLGGLLPPLSICGQCGVALGPSPRWTDSARQLHCADCLANGNHLVEADMAFLRVALQSSPIDLRTRPGASLQRWLDELIREVAECRLGALDFFRAHAAQPRS